MLFIPIFLCLFLTTHGIVLERATCGTDNCGRAVGGTAAGVGQAESRRSDCVSFLQTTIYTTVTPTPTTATLIAYVSPVETNIVTLSVISVVSTTLTIPTTSTVIDSSTTTSESELDVSTTLVLTETSLATLSATVTTSTTTTSSLQPLPTVDKRDLPAGIPSYASACSVVSRYSSACACFGNAPVTVTSFVTQTQLTISTTQTSTISTTTQTSTTEVSFQTQSASSYVTFSSFTTLVVTEISTLTSFVPTTTTVTSLATTTEVTTTTGTYTALPTKSACTNPALLATKYSTIGFVRRTNLYTIAASTLQECCKNAYSLVDIQFFSFEGTPGSCVIYQSPPFDTYPGTEGQRLSYCPRGVAPEEILDVNFQTNFARTFYPGPCDVKGQSYLY